MRVATKPNELLMAVSEALGTSNVRDGLLAHVRRLAIDHGCAQSPVDLVRLAGALGVARITERPLPCDAMLIPKQGSDEYEIALNQAASTERQRFSLAHELGHVVLHRLVPDTRSLATRSLFIAPGNRIEEDLCDFIACELLMPADEVVRATHHSHLSIETILRAAGQLRSSLSAVSRRIAELYNIDFALLTIVRNERWNTQVRVLKNFASHPLRSDIQRRSGSSATPARIGDGSACFSGWAWFEETQFRRRWLHHEVLPSATSVSHRALCLLGRSDPPRLAVTVRP
ncbi:MAG: ImmA/IrrE family metallo-endopeptidase [Phycisphaerales bacterium]